MKQITIDTGNTSGLGAFGVFQKEGLQPGDTLRIVKRPSLSPETWAIMLLLVMQAANYFLRKKSNTGRPDADDFMNDVAQNGKGLADMQAVLKMDHNVKVETDPPLDDDYEAWRQFGMAALNRAYSDDEPDISNITLLEPNPEYKPWKPGS